MKIIKSLFVLSALLLCGCEKMTASEESIYDTVYTEIPTSPTSASDTTAENTVEAETVTELLSTEAETLSESAEKETESNTTESVTEEYCSEETTISVTEHSYSSISNSFFAADDTHVKTMGRTLFKDNIRWLGYTCSSAEYIFSGTESVITLITNDTSLPKKEQPYCMVTIDGTTVFKDTIDKETKIIVQSNENAEHTVRITKLSEASFSALGIKCIQSSISSRIFPTDYKDHKIEFIGDSLTCGYGDEAKNAYEPFATYTENGLLAYAALTAERLGYDYNIIGMNGIGIVSRYTPHGEKKTDDFLMPDLYRYTDGFRSDELWDSSRFVPDICVIALGANDNSYTLGDPEKEQEFSDGYISFIHQVRECNPHAYILCVSGIQRSNLADTIQDAVDKYVSFNNDTKVSMFRFDPQREYEGYGSDYHPSAVSQERFADELYNEICRLIV